jgi:hypothetical protein
MIQIQGAFEAVARHTDERHKAVKSTSQPLIFGAKKWFWLHGLASFFT